MAVAAGVCLSLIAQIAERVTVFQRTANFSVPAANAPLTEEEDRAVKADYEARREMTRNSPTGLGFQPGKNGFEWRGRRPKKRKPGPRQRRPARPGNAFADAFKGLKR